MRKIFSFLLLFILVSTTACSSSTEKAETTSEIPAKNTVTLVDLGAKTCIPCKLMAPILAELEKEYAGRAAIIFIDVWEKPEEAKRFKVSTIPTQIFYDKSGKEVYRHIGFLDKKSMVERLEDLLQ